MNSDERTNLSLMEFDRLKKKIKGLLESSKAVKSGGMPANKLPDEIGFCLTNRCNLRCKHCFEWNNDGFYQNYDEDERNRDLDIGIIEKVLAETREVKSNIYLWGGEPLYHSNWDSIADLLEKDKRWTVICTNGILIEKNMESLLKISENLALLISVDGFEDENDMIRGNGSFQKTTKAIELLLEMQRKNEFKGKISIECTINDGIIGKMYDLTEYFEEKQIDSFYFCFPWFIPDEICDSMDEYFTKNFNWLCGNKDDKNRSWQSYKFRVSQNKIKALIEDIKRIRERKWKVRSCFQPPLKVEEIEDFINGKGIAFAGKAQCLSIHRRMDILANGKVSSCKLFSEFEMGDLKTESVSDIWNGTRFRHFRKTLSSELMPVCSRCVLLYLNNR